MHSRSDDNPAAAFSQQCCKQAWHMVRSGLEQQGSEFCSRTGFKKAEAMVACLVGYARLVEKQEWNFDPKTTYLHTRGNIANKLDIREEDWAHSRLTSKNLFAVALLCKVQVIVRMELWSKHNPAASCYFVAILQASLTYDQKEVSANRA